MDRAHQSNTMLLQILYYIRKNVIIFTFHINILIAGIIPRVRIILPVWRRRSTRKCGTS